MGSSSWTRDRTTPPPPLPPALGSHSLSHWTTRKSLHIRFNLPPVKLLGIAVFICLSPLPLLLFSLKLIQMRLLTFHWTALSIIQWSVLSPQLTWSIICYQSPLPLSSARHWNTPHSLHSSYTDFLTALKQERLTLVQIICSCCSPSGMLFFWITNWTIYLPQALIQYHLFGKLSLATCI